MAANLFTYIKNYVSSVIFSNKRKEISGDIVRDSIIKVLEELSYVQMAGVVGKSYNPGKPDKPVFFLASEKGVYTYFNEISVTENICFLCWDGTVWTKVSKEVDISLLLGETVDKAYRGDRGKIAYDHSQVPHAPSNAQKNSDITSEEISEKLPYNVLLNDGTTPMVKGVSYVPIPPSYSFDSHDELSVFFSNNNNADNFSVGDWIKIFSTNHNRVYYKQVNQIDSISYPFSFSNIYWATSDYALKVDNLNKVVKVTKAIASYTPVLDNDIATKEYVDNHGNTSEYVHPTNHPPSIISQDEYNRFVTDTQKSTWDSKQSSLGFTPEDISNKSTDIEADKTSNIKYLTVKAIYDWVIGVVGNITELTTSYKLSIVGAINELASSKVDKVAGKDLSTNDFDDEYKNKVDAAAATIPKTDWNAQSGSITELVNKPTAQQMFNYVSNVPVVGTYCHAGLIVYKAVAGDFAYIPTYETVLVALTVELPDSIFSNVTTSVAVTGNYADVRGLGVGRNNTYKILEQVGYTAYENSGASITTNYFPRPYTGFTEPGNADQSWSLPSIEELQKVLIYKTLLGMSGNYMTSNDFEATRFWAINTTGVTNAVTKTTPTKIKAVCWIRYSPRISGTNTGDETQSTIIAKSAPYSTAYNTYYSGELTTTIPVIQLNSITSQRQYLNLNLNGVRGSIDLRVFSHDIVWDGDWISVSIGNSTDFIQAHLLNKVDIVIETGFGVMNSSGLAKLVRGVGEYLLQVICLDGRLNLETDFSRVIFRFYPSLYNSQFGTSKWINRIYGETLLQSSPNIIINGTSSAPSHSTYMRDTFVWYYNKYGTFSGSSYITNLDSSLPTEPIAGEAVPGRLPSNQYASYPRSKSSDIILNAFQNSLITTDMASMPDIYNIVCHGRDPIPLTAVTLTAGTTTGNDYYGWVNYTATTPADGCVVRFTGLTNNPTLNNVDLKVIEGTSTKFGLSFLDGTRIRLTSNDSGTMIKGIGEEFNFYKYYEPDNINYSSFFAVNSIAVGAGKLSDSDANWQSSYGQGIEFIESTVSDDMIGCPVSWWNLQQQSPAVAIVAAKMKYIKDTTNVSWSTVRMACRETALQSSTNITNHIKWDRYRGFGVIQVLEAITWINLRKTSSKTTIKNSLELGSLPNYIDNTDLIPEMVPLPKKLSLTKPKGDYLDNESAILAGLQVGDTYHTSGIIKVVI